MFRVTRWIVVCLLALSLLIAARPAQADAPVHIVQWGETLSEIARAYGVSQAAIMTANGLSSSWLFAGQRLIIPDGVSQAAVQASGGTHVVQAGETLYRIGVKYGLSWVLIQQANNLPNTYIYAGQTLIIPGLSTAPAASPTPAPTPVAPEATPTPETPPTASATETTYIVQAGDTLFKIGVKFGVSWPLIQSINGLASTRIYTGQPLIIPGADSTPVAATEAAPAETPPPPDGTGRRFLVDLSEQRLYAYEDDTMVRTTLISSGLPQYPTVVGTFYIYLKYESTRMAGPGYDLPNVPYTMYFYKGYGLHGTYWHSNFGTPMSHGCVNMPTEEAQWAFYWADYGTPVTVQW